MDNQQRNNQEIFSKHPEYDLIVSSFGNVFNLNNTPRFKTPDANGYLYTQIKVDGKIKTLKIHRLVAEVFLPEPSKELIEKCSKEHWGKVLVMHKDNNKLNNNIDNLMWGSLEDNTKQAFDDGLIEYKTGSLNGRATLTEDIVHQVCKFFESGGTPKQSIEIFGISQQQATKIRAGIAWKHVSVHYDIKPLKKRSTTRRKP